MSDRRPFLAGNWKMHKTIAEAESFCAALGESVSDPPHCDMLVIPPFLALTTVVQKLAGSGVAVGAQDLSWEESGAFTGEVSGSMSTSSGERACVGKARSMRPWYPLRSRATRTAISCRETCPKRWI